MFEHFMASWPLFQNSYLAGALIALLLSLLGVWIVARDQIFIGAAIAQSSTLGIALGLWLSSVWPTQGGLLQSENMLALFAIIFSIGAALLTAHSARTNKASHESLTGWIFLFSSALSILFVAQSPHGLEEVHRLLSSSIIGATTWDVVIFGLLAIITGGAIILLRRKILLLILDSEMAEAVGMKVKAWTLGSSVWLGLALGLALRVSGMLYTFGVLILPALAAKRFSREVSQMFWVAPILALSAVLAGFLLANFYDFPPAPIAVALLSICALPMLQFREAK